MEAAGRDCFALPGPNRSTAAVTSIAPWQAIHLSPDGQTLAVSACGAIFVWDIPPRTPGGIVLGLMIVEVSLLILWTAWRRRISSPRDRPDIAVKRTGKSLQVVRLRRGTLKWMNRLIRKLRLSAQAVVAQMP